jgi:hypothetical protein
MSWGRCYNYITSHHPLQGVHTALIFVKLPHYTYTYRIQSHDPYAPKQIQCNYIPRLRRQGVII